MKKARLQFTGTSILLLVCTVFLWNCEKDEVLLKQSGFNAPTVSKAQEFFLNNKGNTRSKNGGTSFADRVQWNASIEKGFKQRVSILYTPIALKGTLGKSFVASVEYEGQIKNRIFTLLYDKEHTNKAFSGLIFAHTTKGEFVNAYKYEAGQKTKTFSRKDNYRARSGGNCGLSLEDIMWIVNNWGIEQLSNVIQCVEIKAKLDDGSGTSGGSNGNLNSWGNPSDTLGNGNENPLTGGGSSSNTNSPWWDNNKNTKCKGGKIKDSNGKCKCPQGQTEDLNGVCACSQGYVKDSKENCVKKPCVGDPVKNPEIAPQKISGIRGGMFGWTRTQWNKTRTKIIPKMHKGVDLKNSYGAPIHAIHGGTAKLITQYNPKTGNVYGAGHYVQVTSKINGKTVKILYFHMQKNNRVSGTVQAGDIIGFQGDSGNLKGAILKGSTVSHVHLKAKENGKDVDPLKYLKTKIDPKTGKVIKPCK